MKDVIELEQRELNFKNKFESKVTGFKYAGGYIDSGSPITISCVKCNNQLVRSGGFLRKVMRGIKTINCDHCSGKKVTNVSGVDNNVNCVQCNEPFATKLTKKYCSEKCLRKSRNKRRNDRKSVTIKKLIARGLYDSSISLEKLISKEKNVCYLCGGQCNSNDYTKDDKGSFIFGLNYPSIEHVVPISKGGSHTWDNVKLAHILCNSMKSNKDVFEVNNQMTMTL